jgi:hypothetical protein
VTHFVASFPLSCLCIQACIAHRRNWSPGCSTSSRHISVFRTRWTTSDSSMGQIRPSSPREGLLTPSWWLYTSGAAFGRGFMGRWDPPSRLEGDLYLPVGRYLSRSSLGVSFPLVLAAFLHQVFFGIRVVFYLKTVVFIGLGSGAQ